MYLDRRLDAGPPQHLPGQEHRVRAPGNPARVDARRNAVDRRTRLRGFGARTDDEQQHNRDPELPHRCLLVFSLSFPLSRAKRRTETRRTTPDSLDDHRSTHALQIRLKMRSTASPVIEMAKQGLQTANKTKRRPTKENGASERDANTEFAKEDPRRQQQ